MIALVGRLPLEVKRTHEVSVMVFARIQRINWQIASSSNSPFGRCY